ncbi:N-acetylglucosamine-6-phosphate deacetylase-like [Artemia franciscana]|uniref:N-acetylglucosamine-6-phosphate deacetylase-like n=1 Tax=Artemia franciscana TaxID=6661 RepID=UPI0032DADC6F
MKDTSLIQFRNCRIFIDKKLVNRDLWVKDGKIIDAEKLFFEKNSTAGHFVDCGGRILAPGFIDLELNGGWGLDFSEEAGDMAEKINQVRRNILKHGVTAFCPAIISSTPSVYKQILPKVRRIRGGKEGASVLGVHLEGPFLNKSKKGAHNLSNLMAPKSKDLTDIYGDIENVSIVTLAPELEGAREAITFLRNKNIVVSLGHSAASLQVAESGVRAGATLVTHLYNAMPPFLARDPGLVGLIASDLVVKEEYPLFYSLISDGHHTSAAAMRIAYRAYPDGAILVTDANAALGLADGVHSLGDQKMEVKNGKATVLGTDTLCGSIANLDKCLRIFKDLVDCTIEEALETVTLHPAQALGIQDKKGALNFGCDADFVILDDRLNVHATFIGGECVYKEDNSTM